jgi:hypothetical protein
MHIRKTDLDLDLLRQPKRRSTYELFYRWVEKQALNESVFLMTDNRPTQRHFQMRYNSHNYCLDKIKVFRNISDDPTAANSVSGNNSLAVDHRFTSLEHAVVDIFIAAHARDFRPCPYSSVSDLVKMLNFLHRWQWCDCPFRGC